MPQQQAGGKGSKGGKGKGFTSALGGWAGQAFGKSGVTPQLFPQVAIQAAMNNPPAAYLTSTETAGAMQRREQGLNRDAIIDWAQKQGISGTAMEELKEHLAGVPTAKIPTPLSGTKPYKKSDGKYYQAMRDATTGQIIEEQMPEGYSPYEGKVTQFDRELSEYAQSIGKDPSTLSWDDQKKFQNELYYARQPLAEARMKLQQEREGIAATNLRLRESAEDVKEFFEIQKQLSSSTKIQSTADRIDEYVAHPTGSGDVALSLAFVDAIKPGSGFRFTDAERRWITTGSRGVADGVIARVQQGFKGTTLSDEQRQNMARIIKSASGQIGQERDQLLNQIEQFNKPVAQAVRGGGRATKQMTAPPGSKEKTTTDPLGVLK